MVTETSGDLSKVGIQGYIGDIAVATSIGVFPAESAVRKYTLERGIIGKGVDRIGCTR